MPATRIYILIGTLFWSVSAFSSTSQASQLFQFEFPANGRVIFRSDGSRGPLPTCAASASSNRWAIDASTSAGKAQLAGLLAAAAQGKPVTVVGKGNCDAWGDAETVDNFYYY